MDITPDANAVDIKIGDFKFREDGTWTPEDGTVYHYYYENRREHILVSSIENYGGTVRVFYNGGYFPLLVAFRFRRDLQLKASPNPKATYDQEGVLLIDGKRLA